MDDPHNVLDVLRAKRDEARALMEFAPEMYAALRAIVEADDAQELDNRHIAVARAVLAKVDA
jgi:hypothetical protein